jgi:hypothetical protein
MIIVVNDANILIDLVKLQLVEPFFRIPWEFHSTSLILENELYDNQKLIYLPFIENRKFIIHDLNVIDMQAVMKMQIQKPQLSDNTLRKFAKLQNIIVHGHLWLFDALLEHHCITPQIAIDKLTELQLINSKLSLPKKECDIRIEYWKQP